MAGSQFCNTSNYVWNTRERLGIGATGTVCVGYDKRSGERVAVKMFTVGPHVKSIKREIEVVNHLPRHDNIVKLLGVEEERTSHCQVIIMELCTNGSLFDVITSPENAYGLCETEFKQVIYDVAKGLQHLRCHNFIHKDIKPGNIMRCQKPDGSFVFKLADFGTARELDPSEEGFFSIDGTEEYLYPGMYERALINPQKKEQFSAKIDLWSVGATFFHAATGRLPFQPFRKREDKHLMFQIISKKPLGMVSGWQIEANGPIIYSDKLPNDTRLSMGMAELVTEVLAGLMENDISKMWEFDQFFKRIEQIQKKKIVDVFCVSSCTTHKIFIDPDDPDGKKSLMESIQIQTNLPLEYQELFFANIPFTPPEPILASKLPATTADQPMMLFGGNIKKGIDLLSLPSVPAAPQTLSLDQDLQFAKECARLIYYFKYQVEQVERVYRLTHQAALCYGYTTRQEYSLLEQRMSSFDQLHMATCQVLTSQMARLTSINDTISTLNQATSGKFQNDIKEIADLIRGKEDQLKKRKEEPDLLQTKISNIKEEFASTDELWDNKKPKRDDAFDHSIETMQYMVMIVNKDFRVFQKDIKYRSLDALQQKLHGFAKARLQGMLSDAKQKVQYLLRIREEVHSSITDWLLRMIPLRAEVVEVGVCIQSHSSECTSTLHQADKWENEHKKTLEAVKQKIATCGFDLPNKPQADQIEIPLYLCTRLRQSRNELSTAIRQQKEILSRLYCIHKDASNTPLSRTGKA